MKVKGEEIERVVHQGEQVSFGCYICPLHGHAHKVIASNLGDIISARPQITCPVWGGQETRHKPRLINVHIGPHKNPHNIFGG